MSFPYKRNAELNGSGALYVTIVTLSIVIYGYMSYIYTYSTYCTWATFRNSLKICSLTEMELSRLKPKAAMQNPSSNIYLRGSIELEEKWLYSVKGSVQTVNFSVPVKGQ